MSFFTNAYTDESPYWACHFNHTLHPLYRQCDKCPDHYRCDKALPSLPDLLQDDDLQCDRKCRRCSEAWGCEKLQEHCNLLTMLEVLHGADTVVADDTDKKFWKVKHGCPHDERCLFCTDIVHCFPMRMHRRLSPR